MLEHSIDKQLIVLIQHACKSGELGRALDYTGMLHHIASFDAAGKVAEFYDFPSLKEKMGLWRDMKQRLDDDCELDPMRHWYEIREPVPRSPVGDLRHSQRKPNSVSEHMKEFPPTPDRIPGFICCSFSRPQKANNGQHG